MHKQQSIPCNNSSHRLLSPGLPFDRKNERRRNVTCLSAYELVAVFFKEDYLLIRKVGFSSFTLNEVIVLSSAKLPALCLVARLELNSSARYKMEVISSLLQYTGLVTK